MRLRRWKSTEGNAAVEFGLVLPLLLAILLGIVDWGHVHFTRMTMTNAAREGARVGVVQSLDSLAEEEAHKAAHRYLERSGASAAKVDADLNDNGTLTVRVFDDDFTPLIGFVPTPGQLSATAAMRWELAPLD
jgi:Flp pilus assembly protein TadG